MSRKKIGIFCAITLIAVIILTILLAPVSGQKAGSTYGRTPSGYGAWYEYMQERGTNIERWQKPFKDLPENSKLTLLRIYPAISPETVLLTKVEQHWLEKGNKLIILGVAQPVTAAKFRSEINTAYGLVRIDTRRRRTGLESSILEDQFGAIIWQKPIGKGQLILSTTPYLAANAYQKYISNYNLLAQLVSQDSPYILVDEYLHGYRDKDVIEQETGGNILSYFRQTFLMIVIIQGLILLIIIIWSENQRFGQLIKLKTPQINNSQAYIEALASVLRKAEQQKFILTILGQEEQKKLQTMLGLGGEKIEDKLLIKVWQEKTDINHQELTKLLEIPKRKSPVTDHDLRNWLQKWSEVKAYLNGDKLQLKNQPKTRDEN